MTNDLNFTTLMMVILVSLSLGSWSRLPNTRYDNDNVVTLRRYHDEGSDSPRRHFGEG